VVSGWPEEASVPLNCEESAEHALTPCRSPLQVDHDCYHNLVILSRGPVGRDLLVSSPFQGRRTSVRMEYAPLDISLHAEEDTALDLMVRLIQDYEEGHHPLPDPTPHEMLVYLMEQRGLKQADLLPIFKSSGYVSDVINEKRAISKAHAKQLAEFFKVSASLFI
jgi:antitoxin component HigA of HigAB toxin-antitoxin module